MVSTSVSVAWSSCTSMPRIFSLVRRLAATISVLELVCAARWPSFSTSGRRIGTIWAAGTWRTGITSTRISSCSASSRATGASSRADAAGRILTTVPSSTATKPCTRRIDRKIEYSESASSGADEMTVTLPLTRGSMMKFLPVILETISVTVCRSVSLKLSVISSACSRAAASTSTTASKLRSITGCSPSRPLPRATPAVYRHVRSLR